MKKIVLIEDYELVRNTYKKIINEYMEKKYKKINALHDAKLLEEPTNKILNKQKDKDIENIIINKYYLTQKGYKSDYIEKYIEQQYKEIEKKYNKQKIDFID
jgi:hypothetical protein